MLPPALSDDACSLAPGVERLAVTAEIELAPDGDAALRQLLPQPDPLRRPARLRPARRVSSPAARGRRQRRRRRSRSRAAPRRRCATAAGEAALEVSTAEPEFEFDAEGRSSRPTAVEQTEAHGLIEQLMVCTNEQVAELLERAKVPTLYRVHERPDPARVGDLIEQLAALDVPTPPLPETISPSQAGELAADASRLVAARGRAARARPGGVYIARAPLAEARRTTCDENLGHAGLGSPAYAHFTSPIRRYPDLIAHRALLSAVGAGESRARAQRGREAGRAVLRARARGDEDSSATPTTSAPPSCSSASSSRPGRDASSRARSRA